MSSVSISLNGIMIAIASEDYSILILFNPHIVSSGKRTKAAIKLN